MHATAVSDVERAPREHLARCSSSACAGWSRACSTPSRRRASACTPRACARARTSAASTTCPAAVHDEVRPARALPLRPAGCPREELVRVHASSGTGGKATVVGYTRRDLEMWTDVMARSLTMAGVRPGMVVHNAYGYGLFTGGLGFHQGAERLGATVVPVSGGLTERQVTLLQDLGAQVLCCTPSYALNIAQALAEHGIGPADLALEVGVFGAEPWTAAMGARSSARSACGGEHVRAVGDHRARRRGPVPRGAGRVAHQRGPLPRRGRPSGDRRAAARRRRGRARL